jgi:hypothetical protein
VDVYTHTPYTFMAYCLIKHRDNFAFSPLRIHTDRLCGLVFRVPGYRSRGPRFDSRRYQIFGEVMGLERGPLSLVRKTEELLELKIEAPA